MNPEQVQIQTGNHNRSAARDYLETHQHFDEKCWLLHASSEEKDHLAINDEGYFKKRFGFDAPLEQRNAVIKIKNKFDFTDKEIRRLKSSGLLTARKELPTSVCACRCVYFFGISYLFFYLFFDSHTCSHNSHSSTQSKCFYCEISRIYICFFCAFIFFYALQYRAHKYIKE